MVLTIHKKTHSGLLFTQPVAHVTSQEALIALTNLLSGNGGLSLYSADVSAAAALPYASSTNAYKLLPICGPDNPPMQGIGADGLGPAVTGNKTIPFTCSD